MILVIDDDLGIRTSLTLVLKRSGYDVKTVASPTEAMSVVRVEAPQLILMDMNFSLSQWKKTRSVPDRKACDLYNKVGQC